MNRLLTFESFLVSSYASWWTLSSCRTIHQGNYDPSIKGLWVLSDGVIVELGSLHDEVSDLIVGICKHQSGQLLLRLSVSYSSISMGLVSLLLGFLGRGPLGEDFWMGSEFGREIELHIRDLGCGAWVNDGMRDKDASIGKRSVMLRWWHVFSLWISFGWSLIVLESLSRDSDILLISWLLGSWGLLW